MSLNRAGGGDSLGTKMARAPVNDTHRPDLPARSILLLAATVIAWVGLVVAWPYWPTPGSASGQLTAATGALLLLAPLVFVVMKRSGLAQSPPRWFIAHVLATALGCCLVFVHAAAGEWLSPPGLVLLLMLLLVLQGSLLRAHVSRGFSQLFAHSSLATGFSRPGDLDKAALQALIDSKTELLRDLDPKADEALFSPALEHWLRHPLQSYRYQRLAQREAAMIGVRRSAGFELGWSRRLHMLVALGFYLGLLAHVVVVLFFAGYAADGGPIDWWYITDWGR